MFDDLLTTFVRYHSVVRFVSE